MNTRKGTGVDYGLPSMRGTMPQNVYVIRLGLEREATEQGSCRPVTQVKRHHLAFT
jgi:hypothetical protein